MRVSLTIEDERENLDDIIKVVQSLRVPATVEVKETLKPQPVVQQGNIGVTGQIGPQMPLGQAGAMSGQTEDGNGQEPPKRRGRPPKMKEVSPSPLPSSPSSPSTVEPLKLLPDNTFLDTVKTFYTEHPILQGAVQNLLTEFNAQNVTSVPPSRREEFLAQMENLLNPSSSSMLR